MSIKEQVALAKKAAQASRRANPEIYPTYLALCAARAALAEAKDRHDRLRRRWAEECGRPKSPRAPNPPECGGEKCPDLERELTALLRGVKINIPSSTMEQVFAQHYKRGYAAGWSAAYKRGYAAGWSAAIATEENPGAARIEMNGGAGNG